MRSMPQVATAVPLITQRNEERVARCNTTGVPTPTLPLRLAHRRRRQPVTDAAAEIRLRYTRTACA
jgi:hypothetical protein